MGISIGAIVSLVYFSPIANDNRLLSREERTRYKKDTTIITILFFVVELLLSLFHLYTCATCISIGMIMSAGLQFPALFKRNQKQQKSVV